MSYKSGHILLRAARFAAMRDLLFRMQFPIRFFVAPAVEIGVKYEWLTKDNITDRDIVSVRSNNRRKLHTCLNAKVAKVRTAPYNSHAKIPCSQMAR